MCQYEIKNIELANRTGVSASFISKIRRGVKVPAANSGIYKAIFDALDDLLSEDQIRELRHQYQLSWDRDSFCSWISEEETRPLSRFSFCLCKLMEFFDLQNNTLARAVNFDPSLISKYRTGRRVPDEDSGVGKLISGYFAKQAIKEGREREIMELMGCPDKEIKTVEQIEAEILSWMLGNELDAQLTDKIFHMMQEYHYPKEQLKHFSGLLQGVDMPYHPFLKKRGNEGLREQVLLFLGLCAKSKEPMVLKLFSSQSMDWMLEDPQFFEMWRALMLMVLECGHKIIIVHNVERTVQELLSAVEGWLPLHLSGNIESYYYTASTAKSFSNTIFVSSGRFAVYGNGIADLEEETEFYFIKENQSIERLETAFEDIINYSQKLLKTFYVKKLEDTRDFVPVDAICPEYGISLMQQSLPIWHMQEELLLEILEYNRSAPEEIDYIRQYVKQVRQFYEGVLKKNKVFEFFYLPDPEDTERQRLDFLNIYGYEPIYYRRDHYERHLENTVDLLGKYENYHIVLLDRPMHNEIKLFQFEENSIMAIKNKFPVSAIQYQSEMIIGKFRNYMFARQKKAISSLDHYEEVCRRCLSFEKR